MRITFVAPPVNMTGGIKVIVIYAQRLMRKGHNLCIVSPPLAVPSLFAKAKSWLRGKGWPASSSSAASHVEGSGVEHRVLDRWRPVVDRDLPDADVVIATWWETAEWVNALHPRKGAKAYFIQHHEVFPFLAVDRSRATYRLPLRKIVISRWLEQVMRIEYGDGSVDLVPNSVDPDQFFAPVRGKQSIPTVGFVYSTAGFKSLNVSIAALANVKQRLGRVRVIAFGSEHVSPKVPLPPWIEFHYLPPQDQIRLIYGSCDVWLCGSSSEGFYLPLLEAMACRCPVVSTKVGGATDLIQEGVNGFLADVGDFETLADRTVELLQLDPNSWAKMSDAALATTSRYTWDDATDLLEGALQRIQLAQTRDRGSEEFASPCC
jgi:glycosyltransferase involved in cell wall biosynthesis